MKMVDHITADALRPITDHVTSMDVYRFRAQVEHALKHFSSTYSYEVNGERGYSFLVEKEEKYECRTGIYSTIIPKPQPRPVKPSTEGELEWTLYYADMKSYQIGVSCDVEVLRLLDLKFPGFLTYLNVTTAREAFDCIEEEVRFLPSSNKLYLERLTAVLNREYIPRRNGARIYFNECEADQYWARCIGVAEIDYTLIMVAAHVAFRKEIDCFKMQEIDNKWEEAHIVSGAEIYTVPAVKYKHFKEHYCKYLQVYYQYPNSHAKNKKILDQLQNQMDMFVHNTNTLRDKMLNHADSSYYTTCSPSVCPSNVSALRTTTHNANGANSVVANITAKQIASYDVKGYYNLKLVRDKVHSNPRTGDIKHKVALHKDGDNGSSGATHVVPTSHTTPLDVRDPSAVTTTAFPEQPKKIPKAAIIPGTTSG
eukprot:CAMPEP_0168273900 /NCGR_PEP_ID=MMETSP0141_2-20121125/16991_1 /TAXON_ID=44445 /ORGANISM="Pseudo-nitzschia australis, Strain 10249 10 AB" /LENGTH=424 /DNA_ID=CAMNT_0008215411 /DNA_START=206 /DNA_END=1481 /DNA_ORIENTATION=+